MIEKHKSVEPDNHSDDEDDEGMKLDVTRPFDPIVPLFMALGDGRICGEIGVFEPIGALDVYTCAPSCGHNPPFPSPGSNPSPSFSPK